MNLLEKLTTSLLFSLFATMLVACNPQSGNSNESHDKKMRIAQCIALQSQCQFDLMAGQVDVLFDVDKITAEQSFNMVVNYHGAETLTSISGYLEGVDMFMGKIPLFIEERLIESSTDEKISAELAQPNRDIAQVKQTFQAEVLVGSCSAEQMTWRIWLTFTTSENKSYSKTFTVMSYRS
ncbi:MAG: hypothetical protein WBC60_06115 [Cognaticolwellia sp.]